MLGAENVIVSALASAQRMASVQATANPTRRERTQRRNLALVIELPQEDVLAASDPAALYFVIVLRPDASQNLKQLSLAGDWPADETRRQRPQGPPAPANLARVRQKTRR